MTAITAQEQSQLSESLKNDARDVADIWRDALKAYKGIVGFDLVQKFPSTTEMIAHGANEMNNFHKFRHNEKKVDKLRTLFANNLDFLETGAQQLIAAATPAFPPAAAIGTAVTFMLSACRQVSADYDIVVVFFEDMNAFLQRIVILETRMPKYKAYQNCLMDVFTAFLTMCAFAHKYIELGRFKKWITSLMFGQDEELGGARKSMDTQLARLQSATEFAILANTEESKRMEAELLANQTSHGKLLEEQRAILGNLQETTDHIHSGVMKLISAFEEQKRLQNHQRGDGETRGSSKDSKSKAAAADKAPSAMKIRNLLPEIEGEIHEYHILEETQMEDTCSWVFSETQWKEWAGEDVVEELRDGAHDEDDTDTKPRENGPKLLAVIGQPGTGKSHIAATIYNRLWNQAQQSPDKLTCVAHFYFREQHQSLSRFVGATTTVVNQIAEQNPALCEAMSVYYKRDEVELDIWVWEDHVNVFLAHAFRKGAKHRLFLILDGIDEMDNLDNFIEFLKIVKDKELRISIVVTTRPSVMPKITASAEGGDLPVSEIVVTKEKQAADIKTLVWNRINTLPNLRSFGRYVKQRVADKTEEVSPHMLYAQNILLRFDNLAREGAVLRSLDRPLPVTLNNIYEEMLVSLNRVIGVSHQDVTQTALHLIAFSFRPLQLHEVNSLFQFITGRADFEIDELLQPLSGFIRVGDLGADAEARAKITAGQSAWGTAVQDLEKSGKDDAAKVYSDASLLVKFKERSMRTFFQGNLRPSGEHEPEGKVPIQTQNLRWTPSETHRRLFLITAQLATPTKLEDKVKLGERFKKYSTHYTLQHFAKIKTAEHTSAEKAEVLTAVWNIFTNQHNFASMIEWNKSKYRDIFGDNSWSVIPLWAEAAKESGVNISEDVAKWWEALQENPRSLFQPLAKAHLERLYTAPDLQTALTRLRRLGNALELTDSKHLIKEKALELFPTTWKGLKKSKDDDSDSDSDDDVEDEAANDTSATNENGQSEEDEVSFIDKHNILGVLGLFDVEPTATGYRVVTELLLKFGHREPAESTCKKTLDLIQANATTSPLERFKALVLMAQVLSKRGKRYSARDYVTQFATDEYLENEDIPSAVKQAALVTKARIEAKNDDLESASQAYLDAKLADPSKLTPGHILDEEISLFSEPEFVESYFKTLKRWTTLERLSWLAWDFDGGGERRDILTDTAAKHGELDLVIETYENAIKYLDNVDAGAPFRCALSRVFSEARGDLERAKALLDEVLDSGSTGWPYAVTDQSADDVLEEAMRLLTGIIYTMFCESKDPVKKQKLLDEARGLTSRPLALDVPPISETHMVCHRLPINRMVLKMGSAAEFQKRMTADMHSCFEGLRDKVGWNDGTNLSELSRAMHILSLALPPCPEREELQHLAAVIASARFNVLTGEYEADTGDDWGSDDEFHSDVDESDDEVEEGPDKGGDDNASAGQDKSGAENDKDDDDDGDDDDDESEAPTDEGDLINVVTEAECEWVCEGSCRPARVYKWWGKRPAYECYTCHIFLCDECHDIVTTQKGGDLGRKYCSPKHEFLQLPVEGWKGVKDGKVLLEGHEGDGLMFDELISKVENELCKKAWDIFWQGV